METLLSKFKADPTVKGLMAEGKYEEVARKAAAIGTVTRNSELRSYSATLAKLAQPH
jgi:hypothetical protein